MSKEQNLLDKLLEKIRTEEVAHSAMLGAIGFDLEWTICGLAKVGLF